MTHVPDISQEYAQGAIKTAVLLNSGAIIAALSQLGELSRIAEGAALAWPFSFWILGALLGAGCWWPAFASARNLVLSQGGRLSAEERAGHIRRANALLGLGTTVFVLSLACFGLGAFSIVRALP